MSSSLLLAEHSHYAIITIESARLFTRTLPSRKLRRVWTFTGGRGATVGSVNPTKGAIIPAAVGVDIGYSTEAKRRITLK